MKFILACWFGFWVLLGFLTIFPILAITLRNPNWYQHAHITRKYWLQWCLFWGLIEVEQIYEEPLDENGVYLFISNHTSKLDMITMVAKLPIHFSFMGKEEFKSIPLFGLFFKTIDIPVDIKNPKKAAIAYKSGVHHLNSGKSLAIYPEGTIARSTPKLQEFKVGAFRMAIESKVQLVPITNIGNWIHLPDDSGFLFKPGKVYQYIHKPIATSEMSVKQANELKQKVFHIIENKLAEHGY